MIALSFFSYKGGVGRSMALTNLAKRLVEFEKSVFIIDFDLEAPGVPFKLKDYMQPEQIKAGMVDYIYEFSSKAQIDDLKKYVIPLRKKNIDDATMWFLPAGNSNIDDYWSKLSRINWHDMFYTEGGKGLRFFLDLKEKIRKQYNPDFLLIDSRTGITELSGISLKILADEVVILFINNDENIFGTEKVLSFLNDNEEKNNEKHIKTHLVLTRVPNHNNDKIRFNREYKLLDVLKKQFAKHTNGVEHDIHVIHTDARLQMNEQLAFAGKVNAPSVGIYSEHMNFFEKIFKEKITPEEWEKQRSKIKEAEIFNKARQVTDYNQKIILLTEAIELNGKKAMYFLLRGQSYYHLYDFENAKVDLEKSIQLNPNDSFEYLFLTSTYINLKQLNKALDVVEKMISLQPANTFAIAMKISVMKSIGPKAEALEYANQMIDKFPDAPFLLNARADLFRHMGLYENAQKDIFKAIELSQTAMFYGTLAEIYGDQGKLEEFYLNLTTALSKGLSIGEMRSATDCYGKFRTDLRFIEMLRSYNIDSEDIFHSGPPKTDGQLPEISEEDGFLNIS